MAVDTARSNVSSKTRVLWGVVLVVLLLCAIQLSSNPLYNERTLRVEDAQQNDNNDGIIVETRLRSASNTTHGADNKVQISLSPSPSPSPSSVTRALIIIPAPTASPTISPVTTSPTRLPTTTRAPSASPSKYSTNEPPTESPSIIGAPQPQTILQKPKLVAAVPVSPTDKSVHKEHLSILHLQGWEQKALTGILGQNVTQPDGPRTCKPPKGVPTTCCAGSFSVGGTVEAGKRFKCGGNGFQQLNQVKKMVGDFMKHNPVVASAVQCDVCQLVDIARKRQLNITLLGDSMQTQVYEALRCELSRRGYEVDETILAPSMGKPNIHQNFGGVKQMTVTSPTWNDADVVHIKLYKLYMFPIADRSEHLVQEMLATSQVIVLGLGLHWNWRGRGEAHWKQYGPAMVDFFQRAFNDKQSKVELLTHRESSYQHFDVPGGDYTMWRDLSFDKREKHMECAAARPGKTTDWRERSLRNSTEEAGLHWRLATDRNNQHYSKTSNSKKEVVVLPFYNFTQVLHTAYKSPPDKPHDAGMEPDCTHSCYSPYIYMTVWRSLRMAMDLKYNAI